MNCERATLIALLREAEMELAAARLAQSTPRIVRWAHEVHDREQEVTRWDRAHAERLRNA